MKANDIDPLSPAALAQMGQAELNELKATIARSRASVARTPEFLLAMEEVAIKTREVLDPIIAQQIADAGHSPACRRGCSFCCHQHVPIDTAEARILAKAVQMMPTMHQDGIVAQCRVVARQFPHYRAGYAQRYARKLACPLLRDGSCTVYEVRPMRCRTYWSLDRSACEAQYQAPSTDVQVPVVNAQPAYTRYSLAMAGAGENIGELSSMLLIALIDPAALEHVQS